jgi:hypothetical protein
MNKGTFSKITRRTALALAMTGMFLWAKETWAGQSTQDATVALTTGAWHPAGAEEDHVDVFKTDGNFTYGSLDPNGIFTEIAGYGGMWVVTGNAIELTYWQWPTRKDIYALPITATGTHGVDEHGTAISMTQRTMKPQTRRSLGSGLGEARAPVVPVELQQQATEAVKTYRDSIVFVTGSDGSGSAFIATDGTTSYLMTNVHVAAGLPDAGFKALDGRDIHGAKPSMAVGEDLFRMEYPHRGGKRFKIMQDVGTNVSIGDAVVVLGNAGGAGVVNTLIGKVVGIGPDLVEVDAPFAPGNSGSPIIDLKAGKVIGIATFASYEGFDGSGFGLLGRIKVRRFGYRLDTVKAWQPVEWQSFRAQAVEIEAIGKRTEELCTALEEFSWNTAKLPGNLAHDQNVKNAWQEWRVRKKQHGKRTQKKQAQDGLIAALKAACESDLNAAEGHVTYDYFKRELAEQKKARGEIDQDFVMAVKGE